MSEIWITGDIHGNPSPRLSNTFFPQQKKFEETQEDNVLIVSGDFGLIWDKDGESHSESYWLDWLEDKKFTTVFVDGNHDNHPRIYKYPVKDWNGGKVHEIRPHVLHLIRGEVYTIFGKKFFAFGGASSHDIQDGILDFEDPYWKQKATEMDRQEKMMYRIKGLSWWSEELPTEEEMRHGIEKLQENNNTVDYVITHSPCASIVALLGKGLYEQDVLTKYLEDIRQRINYKRWYFGHMHIERAVNDKDIGIYEVVERIM